MTRLKTALATSAIIAGVASGALALSATTASAHVACNRFGECWHVRDRYTSYPANLGVVFHEDGWRGDGGRHWRWRHDRPDDHGYYYHNHWRGF
jgi:hypothetical protein